MISQSSASPLHAAERGHARTAVRFGDNRTCVAIVAVYLVLQIALGLISDRIAIINHSPDLGTWLEPAQALVAYGEFVYLTEPMQLQTFRPPLYHLYLAAALAAAPQDWPTLVVGGQIAMLLAGGLIVRQMAEAVLKGVGNLALAFTIFNPNAFAAAHLVQAENLYGLFILLATSAALAFARRPGLASASSCAAATAAACLTRPGLSYLAYLMPVGLLVLGALSRRDWRGLRTAFASAIVAAVVLVSAISPWMLHNARAGHGYVLTPAATENYYLRDAAIHLEMYTNGGPFDAARQRLDDHRARWIDSLPEWTQMSERERQDRLGHWYRQRLISYPWQSWLKGISLSAVAVVFGGGSGQLIGLLGLPGVSPMALFADHGDMGYVGAWWRSLGERNFLALLVVAAASLYVVLCRILNVIGVVFLVRKEHYAPLAIMLVVILYHASNTLLYGTARYRLPADALLMLLAAVGFAAAFRTRRRTA